MKVLKFRIWNDKNKMFIYPDVILLNRGFEYQQYIGLQDREGKDIYEDDIVEYENINYHGFYTTEVKVIGVIRFRDGVWYAKKIKTDPQDAKTIEFKGIELKYSTVIGNVYENPELLEER